MSETPPILTTCTKCGQPMTLTGDDARDWRPGATVAHKVCPTAERPTTYQYSLDLVLRASPMPAEGEPDLPIEDTEMLARATRRVEAVAAPDALNQLLAHTNDLWERLSELAPIADSEWRIELSQAVEQ